MFNNILAHGHEIRHGKMGARDEIDSVFIHVKCDGLGDVAHDVDVNGGVSMSGWTIWDTTIHGLFENYQFRCAEVDSLRKVKGLSPRSDTIDFLDFDQKCTKLAGLTRSHLDIDAIRSLFRK